MEQVVLDTVDDVQQACEGVRERIAEVLLEIDHITLQVNPQILADYAIKIGCYENELFKEQIAARRAKRRLELAQARVNTGRLVAEHEIEETLDEEMAAWEEQLEHQIETYLATLERHAKSSTMLPRDAREVRDLHRKLVKRLHPDLHPLQSETEQRLFAILQEAYRAGDLETLRSLDVASAYVDQEMHSVRESEDEARVEYELLCAQLSVTQERLDVLKNSVPYILGEKLASSAWVHKRVQELKQEIEEQQEARKAYDDKYAAFKEVPDDR